MFERILLGLYFQTDKTFLLIGSLSLARAGGPTIAPFGLTSQTDTTGKSFQDQRGRTPVVAFSDRPAYECPGRIGRLR
jgi:hypothetical protein